MRKIQLTLIVAIVTLFGMTATGAEFYDIDKPGIKKKVIYLTVKDNSRLNNIFTRQLKDILDQSLLFQVESDAAGSDYRLQIEKTVENGETILSLAGINRTEYAEKRIGVRFQDTEAGYIQLKAAQAGNRILKELFGIDGSFGSTITWSNEENNRKVLYKAAFGLADSTEQVSFNLFTNLNASWSPDQNDIVYTGYTDQGTTILYQQINPLLLQTVKIFPELGVASSPDWAPDGTIFLTIHISEQNSDIEQYRLPGNPYQGNRQLQKVRKWTFDKTIETEPSISPDGKSMAYVSDQTGSPQIYLLDLNSGQSRRLTRQGGYNVTPAWSPNGKMIAFRGIRDGVSAIYRLDIRSGEEKRVTPLELDAESPAWSPDGSLIAFAAKPADEKTPERKVFYILSSGGEYRPLATPASHQNLSNPSWGPALR